MPKLEIEVRENVEPSITGNNESLELKGIFKDEGLLLTIQKLIVLSDCTVKIFDSKKLIKLETSESQS